MNHVHLHRTVARERAVCEHHSQKKGGGGKRKIKNKTSTCTAPLPVSVQSVNTPCPPSTIEMPEALFATVQRIRCGAASAAAAANIYEYMASGEAQQALLQQHTNIL